MERLHFWLALAVTASALSACPPDPDTTEVDGGYSGSTSSISGHTTRSSTAASSSSNSSAPASSSSSSPSDPGSSQAASGSATSSSVNHLVPVVFGHSATRLFLLDVDSLAITDLGAFQFRDSDGVTPLSSQSMTDLAITADGAMYGCSFNALFRVELPSLVARKVASLADTFNGLTFVPAGFLEPDREVLLATVNDPPERSLYRIDVNTGAATLVGSFGNNLVSSGDVVAIRHDAMYAVVHGPKVGTAIPKDFLARINPATGGATVIGTGIGFNQVWGLGYWYGVLYGFAKNGKVVAIDPDTGVGTLVDDLSVEFWGAGTTTIAPISKVDAGHGCQCEGCLCGSDAECCGGMMCTGGRCEMPG